MSSPAINPARNGAASMLAETPAPVMILPKSLFPLTVLQKVFGALK